MHRFYYYYFLYNNKIYADGRTIPSGCGLRVEEMWCTTVFDEDLADIACIDVAVILMVQYSPSLSLRFPVRCCKCC